MGTSSETHEDVRAGSAIEGAARLAAASPSWPGGAQERSPFAALPDGWSVIGRCRFGTGVPGPHATGCYALAHPKVGIALIDIVPDATPNAEARLRRALTAAEFWPDFPGTLPVVHNRLDAAALRSLPWVLERWFTALPALTVPGGSAWVEGVRRAMAVDPAWELPGQPKSMPEVSPTRTDGAENAAAPPSSSRPARGSARPRRWGRVATLPLAFTTVFGLGLVSGFLLLESPAPVSQPAVVAAPPQAATAQGSAAAPANAAPKPAETTAAAVPVSPAPAAPVEAPKPGTETAALPAEPQPAPALAATTPPAPRPESSPPGAEAASQAAADAPAIQRVAGLALGGAPTATAAASPLETRVSHAVPIGEALPMAPPPAPSPPPVRVSAGQPGSRSTPVIDRACSQALFRFQQGERLTTAEQNFIRNGCSTARR